jgi:xanthine dehydrogenase accessory factor
LEEIKEALLRGQTAGSPCVIATVIEVDGSAYRREGARCLIMPDGEVTGILSGGCIEEELRGHADEVLKSGEARTVRYDFRTGEDDVWGTGIGCNGAIAVWLELFDPAGLPDEAERIVGDMRQRSDTRVSYEAVTVVGSSDPGTYPSGTRWTCPHSTYSGRFGAGQTAGIVQETLGYITLELLVEEIAPRPELLIVGVGEDARLLCRTAKMLQWRVTILYHGTDRASRDRFPEADYIQIIPRLAFELADTRGKFAVIMTHQLELDREAVRKLLTEEIAYVGLVGSRYRLERILNELDTEEAGLSRRLLDKLYSPVGLDIGAETPQEIAMSIMAEMMAYRSGRSGSPLRNRKGIPLSQELAQDCVRSELRYV